VKAAGMYSMPYSEDYDLFWQIARRYKIGNLAEPLVDYRLSPTSLNTVLRKHEYDIANEQNVLRNIRYYMGNDFTISKENLEVLRHNFVPIVQRGSISAIITCLAILKQINQKILSMPNANQDPASIQQAIYFKREFIITQCSRELSPFKGLCLLLRTGSFRVLNSIFKQNLMWRFKNLKSFIK
jgi:hypothetical protein